MHVLLNQVNRQRVTILQDVLGEYDFPLQNTPTRLQGVGRMEGRDTHQHFVQENAQCPIVYAVPVAIARRPLLQGLCVLDDLLRGSGRRISSRSARYVEKFLYD